jgi:host factor-I protein
MEAETRNLQNDFFNAARRQKAIVTVFLGSGKRLSGRIKSFDRYTLLLESPQGDQIVFKHAISIVSASPRAAEGVLDDGPRQRAAVSDRSPLDPDA